MKKYFVFLVFLAFSLQATSEFVVMTPPHSGSHLLVPLIEEMTGREGIWPYQYFVPYEPCDEETFEKLARHLKYLAYLWNKKPVSLKRFRRALNWIEIEGQFMFLHTPYTPSMEAFLRKRGVKVFALKRDPRDMCLSAVYHCQKFGAGLIENIDFLHLTFDQQVELMIVGTDWCNSMGHIYRAFRGWEDSSICCTLDFASLLGPWGGGATKKEQLRELRKLAQALEVEFSDKELIEIFQRVYGTGYTFDNVKVGMWKEHFNEKHLELYNQQISGE